MKWLEKTHGVRFELMRHFLARMFDSEMFSTRGQWRTVAVSAFALAVPAGMFLLEPPYYHRPVLPTPEVLRAVAIADGLAMLTLASAITGILALLAWQSLFPSRRDYLALAGLPVRSRQIFAARAGSVLLMAAAIIGAMTLLSSVVAPHQFTANWGAQLSLAAKAAARAASAGLACAFVFLAIAAIQGLLINALPPRLFTRWSTCVQGGLMAVFVLAALFSWYIVDWREEAIARLPAFGAWMPPVWFLGVHQVMVGDRDPFFAAMASRGLAAAAGSLVAAALLYLLAYRRYRKLLLETPDVRSARREWKWSYLRLLSRDPRQQAVLEFLAKVISRSRVHRLVLLAYLGAAVALMINSVLIGGAVKHWPGGWPEILRFVVLYWPMGIAFIVLAGVRHAFLMPVDWPANWLFRITESHGRRQWMSAVERFVIGCVIAPLHLVFLPLAVSLLGWPVAVRLTVLQLLVSLAAFDFLFYSWQQLPFTCSYVPGKRPLVASAASWMAVLTIVLPLLARIIAGVSEILEVFLVYGAVICAVWLWARRQRRQGWGEARLIYEDMHGELADLGIRDLSYYRGPESRPVEEPVPVLEPPPAERPVEISRRLYRRLAKAFPYEFKNAHEEELVQTAEDAIEPVWRRHGVFGLLRLLADIAVRIPAEHLAELRQDIRQGLRTLAGSPGFTAVAVISLSLGICAPTCLFSELNATVLHDIPQVANPAELVTQETAISFPHYRRYRERSDIFSSTLAFVAPVPFGVTLGGRTERTWGHLVTPSYFTTLGVRPMLGRAFGDEHERPGDVPQVVVSHRFWQNRLVSDPGVLGTTLRINGHPCTVIGVGPKDFWGASPMFFAADLWLPLSVGGAVAPELADDALEAADLRMFQLVGRLQPGITARRAEAELDTIARQFDQGHVSQEDLPKGRRVLLKALRLVPMRKQDLPFAIALPVVVMALVLLIACANVANMMLARASERRKEIAVRLALGAGRARIVRQLLTESMLVASAAGVLGFLLTLWLMRVLGRIYWPHVMPVSMQAQPDGRVLLFALGLTAFTGLAFGLAPALQATRIDLSPALKEGGNIRFRRYRRLSLRNLIVLQQTAASLTLLLVTGTVVLAFQTTTGIQVGFDTRNLSLISLDPVRHGYSGEQATAFFRKLLERVQRLPSVVSATVTDAVPMAAAGRVTFSSGSAVLSARRHVVGKDHFQTIGIPILAGRGFRAEDEATDAPSVIVSEALVGEFWKGQDPLGRRIEIEEQRGRRFEAVKGSVLDYRQRVKSRRAFEVIGVAKDVRMESAVERPRPAIYFPLRLADYARPSFQGMTLMVRAAPGSDAVAAVRREISAIDPAISPFDVRSMTEQIDRLLLLIQVGVWSYGMMGVFGLILAVAGLTGVTAYAVAQRRREIGIRVALGARGGDVLRLVMKEGAVLVAGGTLIGLAAAWTLTRALSASVEPVARVVSRATSQPALLFGAPLLLAALALAACYVPARKSTRIDPVVTLRQE